MTCPLHSLHLKPGSGFRGPGIPLLFLETLSEQPQQETLSDFWSTSGPGPDIRTLVLPILTQSLFPSMLVFKRISFSCILYETHGRRLPEQWWPVGESGKSLGEHPFSHWTLNSGCNQRVLCTYNFHTCLAWFAGAFLNGKLAKSPPRWHSGYTLEWQRPCTVSWWWHGTVLVTGVLLNWPCPFRYRWGNTGEHRQIWWYRCFGDCQFQEDELVWDENHVKYVHQLTFGQ